MIEAKDLINDTTIFQDYTKNNLEYYHIELNTHSAIIANGVLSESFLNYNNVIKNPSHLQNLILHKFACRH